MRIILHRTTQTGKPSTKKKITHTCYVLYDPEPHPSHPPADNSPVLLECLGERKVIDVYYEPQSTQPAQAPW